MYALVPELESKVLLATPPGRRSCFFMGIPSDTSRIEYGQTTERKSAFGLCPGWNSFSMYYASKFRALISPI